MTTAPAGMTRIPGGEFLMGSDAHYPEEAPARRVGVDGFWIDSGPVTNARFAEFVAATGHVTVAERPLDPAAAPHVAPERLAAGSAVFRMTDGPVDLRDPRQWWAWVPGASWRHPEGPGSHLEGREDHPVVHVSHMDAIAYCEWAGKALPTEAEWELAARGGLEGAEFVWGDEDPQETAPVANTWQGRFPCENTALDGWAATSPVGAYPPNGFGLLDMAGNVWEWTSDWYRPGHGAPDEPTCCAPRNPRGGTARESLDPAGRGAPIPRKVLKGGSFLCTTQYCFRYRPAARQAQAVDTGLSNLGFRCIVRDG